MRIEPNADFLMSTEEECLTSTPKNPEQVVVALPELLQAMATQVPTVAGPTGVFNGFGRAYNDAYHLELAMAESHSPYVLALIAECQRSIAAAARKRLADCGLELVLANNNHSGVLQRGNAVWGSHENYLVESHPTTFTELVLPFLVTRLYAGSGGIEFPMGNYLASVRAVFMEQVVGGDTTSRRAVHSTCREEHHGGMNATRFRYHGILGDGHRSQFNLALQFGATALALKAIIFDSQLPRELAKLRAYADGKWLERLQQFNVLQTAGGELHIDPLVMTTQRIYLDASHRFVNQLKTVPAWVPILLRDWEATLLAYERLDREWLAARLDAFAKYEFYSGVLTSAGESWRTLPGQSHLFAELALLNHSYHSFAVEDSVFRQLEMQGLLQHRVGPPIVPGDEPDPFVPETSTRARARARFIREHSGQDQFVMDWSCVIDRRAQRIARLDDPFAQDFSPWQQFAIPADVDASGIPFRHLREMLRVMEDQPF